MPGVAGIGPSPIDQDSRRPRFGMVPQEASPVPATLTREFYIKRIAVALIICDAEDPKHKQLESKTVVDGKTTTVSRPCHCRVCRAWICVRITPMNELTEAACLAEELKTNPIIDDRLFL